MVNKKAYECLVYSGAFDCFGGYHRAQYFGAVGDKFNGIERLIKYSNDYQANLLSNQHSLFGGTSEANIAEPGLPDCDPRTEDHTSELQSLMRISYAVICLKKKKKNQQDDNSNK